ncbi:cell division protein FtsW [Candidatus Saccharibacteria bacterium]|nr:cell division protein FtsW [Candidatus Saccharibacteria bacterium]
MNVTIRSRRPSLDEPRRRHRPDYWLPLIAVALLSIGLVVVYAISPGMSALKGVSESYYISKQLIAILLGVAAFIILSKVPYTWWRRAVLPLIIAAIVSAVAVQLFGSRVNGAYRWIQVGGVSFQAAELIKFALLIWMADLLARRKAESRLGNSRLTLQPLVIGMCAIGIVVGVMQSDFGSTAVMVGMAAAMMFVAGVPLKRLAIVGGVIVIGAFLLISTSSYRRERLTTFINPTADCQDAGYQSCQALIAVGSGGMFGLGLARSIQAYGYLPEAANDSIFAILAEKFGFLGVSLIIAAYAVFFGRLTRIIERAPDDFSRLIITGMLAWFSVQTIINIGAMIGLLPLKGITLPFVSYGGTSLLFVTGALGIAFQISRYAALSGKTNDSGATSYDDTAYGRGNRRPYYAAAGRRT